MRQIIWILTFALVCIQQATANADQPWDATSLKKIIQEGLREDKASADIYLEGEKNILYYLDSDFHLLLDSKLDERQRLAMDFLLCAELLRPHTKSVDGKAAIEQLENQANQALSDTSAKIDNLRKTYVDSRNQALQQVAQERHLQSIKEGYTPSDVLKQQLGSVTFYQVTVKTNPAGAPAYYVTELEYFVLNKTGKASDVSNWYRCQPNFTSLRGGTYRFTMQVNGKASSPNKLLVKGNCEITLTP